MRITLSSLRKMHCDHAKIAALTCYDASFAHLLEEAGVEILLVGDSAAMVIGGSESTLAMSMQQMIYHTGCVAAGCKKALIMADMPFGSYQESRAKAFANAAKLMAAGSHMVKIEGGMPMLATIEFLVQRGIPVCAHLGLTPQSVHSLGGYKVQGKTLDDANRLKAEALAVEAAGASMLLLEAIPSNLAREVSGSLSIPTIGIGAGPDCSGQVLVLYDLLGVYPGKQPKFVKNFLATGGDIQQAVRLYVEAVKNGTFPAAEHCF